MKIVIMYRTTVYAIRTGQKFNWLCADDLPLWTRKVVNDVAYDVIDSVPTTSTAA